MPRKSRAQKDAEQRLTARLNEAIANYPDPGTPTQVFLDADSEASAAAEAAAEAADAKARDQESSKSDEAIRLLLEEKAELKRRLELLEEENQAAYGNFQGLKADHPFEVIVHTHEEVGKNYDVDVIHNGNKYTLKRGVATRVPLCVVRVLDDAKVQGVTTVVNPVTGNPERFAQDMHRFPYSARPLPRSAA